ncbi:MAG: hypothetical protein CL678_06610 [Bdellovibrionaceae bacterium]|nr:hypothetical protein [Pseudobdellovibrionaceae bacterium]|tara:strand:+ start:655 stop:1116 length:462 start_codon:yes stop_codon:yes gene_type:complete
MSATKDPNQKIAFVYSNLYQIYKKGKKAAQDAVIDPKKPLVTRGRVLKAGHVGAQDREAWKKSLEVKPFVPAELIGKRVAQTQTIPEIKLKARAPEKKPQLKQVTEETKVDFQALQKTNNSAINELKSNLNQLSDLHSRLNFMLKELEDLIKD